MPYHKTIIKKGVLGEASKIQEELDELVDAIEQNNKIMAMVEASDLYGALKAFVFNLGITMEDVVKMQEATESAFKDGTRK